MQTQQVLGVVGGGMVYASKAAPSKSSDGSFDQLIQMSQNTGTAENQTQKPVETTKKEVVADVKETEKPVQTTETSTDKTETSATTEEKTELKTAEETKEVTDVEAAERMAGILNQVTEVVKEILGLTDEQLNAFMEELGITTLDLLQPETLQNLVLMANSEQDAVILLTDAELLTTVNELTTQVERVLQEAGVTPEELEQAMESPEFEAMVTEAIEQLGETVEAEETKEVSLKEEETDEVESVETAPEVTEVSRTVENEGVQTEGRETETSAKESKTEVTTEVETFEARFVQNLQQAAEEISEITGQKDLVQMIREIADQILDKVKVSVTPETTSLEIVLTPEELGKVNLTVSAEQDGMMKAKFVTENELAKEAIERNLVQFKEMLQEQGLKVDSIEVTVGGFEFDKNGQANESSQEEQKQGNRHFMTDEEIGQTEETDQLARHFMEGGESTVNYMA